MRFNCPHCGELIPAENINIQEMVAVCPACDQISQVPLPDVQKAKRRKVKKPQAMQLDRRGDHLHLAFRTNFRLDKNQDFITSASLASVFTLMAVIMMIAVVTEGAPVMLPLAFLLPGLVGAYLMGLTVYNRTHIDMTPRAIQVSRQPLPAMRRPETVSLNGVESITYEETPASIQHQYDTPRFSLWANRVDGTRRLIMKDLVEDYAIFITRQLNEHLIDTADTDENLDLSRLMQRDDTAAYTDADNDSDAQLNSARH